jgi:hypothetical protein
MILRSIGAVSHGIIDYALVILLVCGPSIAGFAGTKATWAYIFGGVLFALAILTRYPFGIIKIVGLGTHGFVELLLAICLIAAPWYGSFTSGVTSPRFYVAMGTLMLFLWFLTDFCGVRERPPTAPVADRGDGPAAPAR